MEKTPDYGRILATLHRAGQPIDEDLAWIERYLGLADKYLQLTDKSSDKDDADSSPARPKAKKQSA